MNIPLRAGLCLSFLVSLFAQQPARPPATVSEVGFLKHMLMSIANPVHDLKVCKLNEDGLIRLYGLDAQEAAVLHTAGQFGETANSHYDQSLCSQVCRGARWCKEREPLNEAA